MRILLKLEFNWNTFINKIDKIKKEETIKIKT